MRPVSSEGVLEAGNSAGRGASLGVDVAHWWVGVRKDQGRVSGFSLVWGSEEICEESRLKMRACFGLQLP